VRDRLRGLRFASGVRPAGEDSLQTGHGIPWPVWRESPARGSEGEHAHGPPHPHRRGGLHGREHQEPRVHLLQARGADPQGGRNGGGEDFAVHAQICRAFASLSLIHTQTKGASVIECRLLTRIARVEYPPWLKAESRDTLKREDSFVNICG